MKLEFLGDAFDHWKGSIFEKLLSSNILNDFKVDAMISDEKNSWKEGDYSLYRKLLRIKKSQLVMHKKSLHEDKDREGYFTEIPRSGDIFLDPDTGIATSRVPDRHKSSYVMPDELVSLLSRSKDINRIIIVYQHASRAKFSDRLNDVMQKIVEKMKKNNTELSCCGYMSNTAAILFLSANAKRITDIVKFYRDELGEHAEKRIVTNC